MRFKKGDRVKINPKTLNTDLDGNISHYVADRVANYEELFVMYYRDEIPSMGYRVYVKGSNEMFYVYEKDLIRVSKRTKHIEKNYEV